MNKGEIRDCQLVEFCQWYKGHYGKSEAFLSVMTTCLCGRFHTYPREANLLLERCVSLNLMEIHKHKVYLK